MKSESMPKDMESVVYNLAMWRNRNNKRRGQRFPKALREEIVGKCAKHGAELVCRWLGLQGVKRWDEASSKLKSPKASSRPLRLAPIKEGLVSFDANSLISEGRKITASFPKGEELVFEGFSADEVLKAVRELGLC